MTNRITLKNLHAKVDCLNDMLGYARKVYTEDHRGADGRLLVNVGTFVLEQSNDGYRLCQIVGQHGGHRDLTLRGTARQTYDAITGVITGVQLARPTGYNL